ncbi:MAG: selenide, water dikinase SelD, partial [Alphaproteobacteria bacterium]|nr:selenide, water dikinase SelD [Alphaproteobacteria bacterium]
MRGNDFPAVKDIVLVGAGHAHVAVLKSFGMFPINGARLTLISPDSDTPYSGMLPGLIAGHYTFDETHIDLGPLSRFAGARLLETHVKRIDPEKRLVYCADGRPPVPYDVLSVNTGSTPVFDERLVLERDVLAVKPVSAFLDAWATLKERVMADPARRIGVVGAGAGGVELLLSMQYALARQAGVAPGRGPGSFHVFSRDETVLKSHGAGVRDALGDALNARGVTVYTGFDVVKADATGITDGSRHVALDDIVWVTGAQAPDWFVRSGLEVDERGFMAVDNRLRSRSHADVFGAGDAVTIIGDRRPKSGVFAVRQGPVLARNLRAAVLGRRLETYRPQRTFLSLISTGDQYAVASYAGRSLKGGWVWRWKDHIDRRFMRQYNELPGMEERPLTTMPTVADVPEEVAAAQQPDAMRCGGCGAKVGPAILEQVLASLPSADAVGRPDIILGAGDDAAALTIPDGQVLVQTVDSFPAMIDDPFVFGQIAANHCLGDIYAMGAKPHSALAIVALPFAAAAKREADLVQMLAGASGVLSRAGAPIVGGHTGEGAEAMLGFSINGLAKADELARKGGLRPGLALILTKPIGSGVLFAGHGRGRAKGRWVRAAVANALQSNAMAADILRGHGAVAMTDVTGFGVAGHLGEMLKASGVAATMTLSDVPILAGAAELVGKGIVSSLQRDNLIVRERVDAAS